MVPLFSYDNIAFSIACVTSRFCTYLKMMSRFPPSGLVELVWLEPVLFSSRYRFYVVEARDTGGHFYSSAVETRNTGLGSVNGE